MNELEVLRQEYKRLDDNIKINLKEQFALLDRIKKVCDHSELSESFDLYEYNMKVKVCNICKETIY